MNRLSAILREEGLLKKASPDPVAGWFRKNKRGLDEAGDLFEVEPSNKPGEWDWVVEYDVGQQYYWVKVALTDDGRYYNVDSGGSLRGGLDYGGDMGGKQFVRLLNRLLKAALKAKGDETVRVKRKKVDFGYGIEVDPDGGWEVFVGPKKIGEVWKGMDKRYHSSLYGAGYGYRFRSRKDAVEDLIEGGYKGTAKSRGQRKPTFE